MPYLPFSFLVKVVLLAVTVLLLYTLESGRQLLFEDKAHIPLASSFFATSQATLDSHQEGPAAPPPSSAAAASAVAVTGPISQLISLLSSGLPVRASVRGNLGEPSVVTNEKVEDWLADRWQAAANMQGDPIPGQHWLEVDLGGSFALSHFLLDWEKAYAANYTLLAREAEEQEWVRVAAGAQAQEVQRSDTHLVHRVVADSAHARGRYVRLVMHEPATQWGVSLWRLHVYGSAAATTGR